MWDCWNCRLLETADCRETSNVFLIADSPHDGAIGQTEVLCVHRRVSVKRIVAPECFWSDSACATASACRRSEREVDRNWTGRSLIDDRPSTFWRSPVEPLCHCECPIVKLALPHQGLRFVRGRYRSHCPALACFRWIWQFRKA